MNVHTNMNFLSSSSVGLLTFARKNGLDTSAADEIELDIEME